MNAKEQIINVFKNKNIELENSIQRLHLKYGWTNDSSELKILSDAIKNNLAIISATEAAIFDVPSFKQQIIDAYETAFIEAYKKPIIGVVSDNRGQYRKYNSAEQYYSKTYKKED